MRSLLTTLPLLFACGGPSEVLFPELPDPPDRAVYIDETCRGGTIAGDRCRVTARCPVGHVLVVAGCKWEPSDAYYEIEPGRTSATCEVPLGEPAAISYLCEFGL